MNQPLHSPPVVCGTNGCASIIGGGDVARSTGDIGRPPRIVPVLPEGLGNWWSSLCAASGEDVAGVEAAPHPPTMLKRLNMPESPVSCGTRRGSSALALAGP